MLDKIFSIKKDNEKKTITILGIKFNFSRRKNIVIKSENILNNVGELLGLSKTEKQTILSKYLRMIEIEVFSYCNRQCWFCPNSFIDRHSENHLMDENLYLNILQQLHDINYSGIITYSRYNEPLSNREIFIERLKQAREFCPNAYLRTNSNGDFLTSKEYLDALAEAGLNELEVQCYLKYDEDFNINRFIELIGNFSKRLKLKYNINEITDKCFSAKIEYNKLNLSCIMFNFKDIANNRGETLKGKVSEFQRTENCIVPFQSLYVDYTGDVMLCCNLRHDVEEHKNFIIGNTNNSSLSDIFMSEKMINYRKLLACTGEKIPLCNTCKFFPGDIGLNLIQ